MWQWTDAHNHLQDPRLGDAAALLAVMRRDGIDRCVVNGTSPHDWDAVAAMAADFPHHIIPAFGVHPWQAHRVTPGWQNTLLNMLENHPRASLGECGLDGWVGQPPLDVQWPVWLAQLRMARRLDRPMTIHCLKAWGPLFESFAAEPPPPRFLMHAFAGSLDVAKRLLPMGAWFSFSGYFLHPKKSRMLEVFRQLPRERILVETDAPSMAPPAQFRLHDLPDDLNHPGNLAAIGHELARVLGMNPEDLAALTRANAASCFGI